MYQIVSTYFSTRCVQSIVFGLKTCLQSSFGLTMCTPVLSLNTLETCLPYMLCGYKKENDEPSGSSVLFFKKGFAILWTVFRSKIPRFFFVAVRFGFVASLCFWKRNADLIPKRVRRYFQNSYSYPNAVRRSVRTSSCSLIILNQRKSPSATLVSKE